MLSSSTQPPQCVVTCGACHLSSLHVNSRFLYCPSNAGNAVPTRSPYKCPNCTYAAAVKGINCKYYQLNTAQITTSRLQVSAPQRTVMFYANPPQFPGGTSFTGGVGGGTVNTFFRRMSSDDYEELIDTTQHSRRRNLEITGVPVAEDEDLYLILFLIANAIGVCFIGDAILEARRLRVPNNLRREDRVVHPHIIVTFVSRQAKMAWSDASRGKKLMASALMSDFSETRVFINDHLTWRNKVILGSARRHVRAGRLAFAWTVDCKVLVKKSPSGPTGRVFSVQDVDSVVREGVH